MTSNTESGPEPVRYRKKPVTIETMRVPEMLGRIGHADLWDTARSVAAWCGGQATLTGQPGVRIDTLEGTMLASPGDFIIKGVQGEFYPCKPGIFDETYEQASGSGDALAPAQWVAKFLDLDDEHRLRAVGHLLDAAARAHACYGMDHVGRLEQASRDLARLQAGLSEAIDLIQEGDTKAAAQAEAERVRLASGLADLVGVDEDATSDLTGAVGEALRIVRMLRDDRDRTGDEAERLAPPPRWYRDGEYVYQLDPVHPDDESEDMCIAVLEDASTEFRDWLDRVIPGCRS